MTTAAKCLSLDFPQPDIALVRISTSGAPPNVLSLTLLEELDELLGQLATRSGLAGLLISSAGTESFLSSDLDELAELASLPPELVLPRCRRGAAVLKRLAECPFVTVAVIAGECRGRGAELTTWCDRRVFSDQPHTRFGFSDVTLGLTPGWGGTVRTARLAGLRQATALLTTGEMVDVQQVAAMHLADAVVPAEQLVTAAITLIRQAAVTGAHRDDRQRWQEALETNAAELQCVLDVTSLNLARLPRGQRQAASAVLELLVAGLGMDAEAAEKLEADAFCRQCGASANAALLHAARLRSRQQAATGSAKLVSPGVQSVGLIGAGIMGIGIAAAHVKQQLRVTVWDASAEALAKSLPAIIAEAAGDAPPDAAEPPRGEELTAWLQAATSEASLATCDLVIETVVENAAVKRQIFQRLEHYLQPHTILASNTSTIPIATLAQPLAHPERFCGLHFCNPVRVTPLVEVVRGPQTSEQTVATVVQHIRHLGKLPVVVQDAPGFVINRVLAPYLNEALILLCEGASLDEVDTAALAFGMPLGPLAMCDLIGLDTAFYAGRTMWEAFPERIVLTPLLPAFIKRGRLGRKSGSGFYSYRNPVQRPDPDPVAVELIEPYVRRQGPHSAEEVTLRLLLPMVLEATRVLEQGIVSDARDIDLAMLYGLAFPAFQGGLLYWADTLGPAAVLEFLRPLQKRGPRFQPSGLLVELARAGRTFYSAAGSAD